MAKVPEATLSWLYKVLHEYSNPQKAYSDTAQTLASFQTLQPRTEVHTWENGSSALLVVLSGTIPSLFRGTSYQFPVKIWIPQSYPHDPPFLYVIPGKELVIRPGQHVGVDGRLYHPYLRDWQAMRGRANLVELLGVFQQAFAKEPPVTGRQQMNTAPLLPPKPGTVEPIHNVASPPPRPPKAGSTVQQQGPALPPLPASRTPARYDTPAPLPNEQRSVQPPPAHYTAQTYDRLSHPHSQQQVRDNAAYSNGLSFQGRQSSVSPQQLYQQTMASRQQQHAQIQSVQQLRPQQRQQQQQQHSMVQPKKTTQDLLSDPFDVVLPPTSSTPAPAPPIPPNPERIHLLQALSAALVQQARQKVNQNMSALAPLQAQQDALRMAHSRLDTELAQLQALDRALGINEVILHQNIQDCDRAIQNAKTMPTPPVDDILVAPTLVAQKLWNISAEEVACQETMHALQKALDMGRINASQFVKQIRGLSRERFLKMALARKCAVGLGLEVQR